MSAADKNHDGKLDYKEFRAHFGKGPTHSHERLQDEERGHEQEEERERPPQKKPSGPTKKPHPYDVAAASEASQHDVLRRMDNGQQGDLRKRLRSTRPVPEQVMEEQVAPEDTSPAATHRSAEKVLQGPPPPAHTREAAARDKYVQTPANPICLFPVCLFPNPICLFPMCVR